MAKTARAEAGLAEEAAFCRAGRLASEKASWIVPMAVSERQKPRDGGHTGLFVKPTLEFHNRSDVSTSPGNVAHNSFCAPEILGG